MSGFSHGGSRIGAGRKKGGGSTVVRVPNAILDDVRKLILSYKLESCNSLDVSHKSIDDSVELGLPDEFYDGLSLSPGFSLSPKPPKPLKSKNAQKRERKKRKQ